MTNSGIYSEEKIFYYSRQSCDILDYPCFDDQSVSEWLDGEELKNNPDWSKEQKELWLFMYRPYNYGNNIASFQKEQIKKKRQELEDKKIQADFDDKKETKEVDSSKSTRNILLFNFLFILAITYLSPLLFLYDTDRLLLVVLLSIVLLVIAASVLFRANVKQPANDYGIENLSKEIDTLNLEVDYLTHQQQDLLSRRISSQKAVDICYQHIKELEGNLYQELFDTNITNTTYKPLSKLKTSSKLKASKTSEYFTGYATEHKPVYPLIPSWALLQPFHEKDGRQSLGLDISDKKLRHTIASFRKLDNGYLLYRFWHLKFLFFGEKSITIVSVNYDVIGDVVIHKVRDIFQYAHLTNVSLGGSDISYVKSSLIDHLKLDRALIEKIFDQSMLTLSCYAASGSGFHCVLPDQDVLEGIAKWQKVRDEKMLQDEQSLDIVDYHARTEKLEKITSECEDRMYGLAARVARELIKRMDKFSNFKKST